MGALFSMWTASQVRCDYCGGTVNERSAVVKVFSLGKLDGHYLCNYCLLSNQRKNIMWITG